MHTISKVKPYQFNIHPLLPTVFNLHLPSLASRSTPPSAPCLRLDHFPLAARDRLWSWRLTSSHHQLDHNGFVPPQRRNAYVFERFWAAMNFGLQNPNQSIVTIVGVFY